MHRFYYYEGCFNISTALHQGALLTLGTSPRMIFCVWCGELTLKECEVAPRCFDLSNILSTNKSKGEAHEDIKIFHVNVNAKYFCLMKCECFLRESRCHPWWVWQCQSWILIGFWCTLVSACTVYQSPSYSLIGYDGFDHFCVGFVIFSNPELKFEPEIFFSDNCLGAGTVVSVWRMVGAQVLLTIVSRAASPVMRQWSDTIITHVAVWTRVLWPRTRGHCVSLTLLVKHGCWWQESQSSGEWVHHQEHSDTLCSSSNDQIFFTEIFLVWLSNWST